MSKRKSYQILGEHFATKTALQDRIKSILHLYEDGQRLSVKDFEFMLDVLRLHPDSEQKIGNGVEGILIKTNPVYTSTKGFWIVRLDRSETDFSYIECLKETSHGKRFAQACRVAVEPYTMAYKQRFFDELNGKPYYCPYTCEPLTFIGSHVDHKVPETFQKILADFVREFEIDVSLVKVNGKATDNAIQDTLDDEELEQTWIEYHARHAQLQIVSRKANLSLLKTGAAPNNRIEPTTHRRQRGMFR